MLQWRLAVESRCAALASAEITPEQREELIAAGTELDGGVRVDPVCRLMFVSCHSDSRGVLLPRLFFFA